MDLFRSIFRPVGQEGHAGARATSEGLPAPVHRHGASRASYGPRERENMEAERRLKVVPLRLPPDDQGQGPLGLQYETKLKFNSALET